MPNGEPTGAEERGPGAGRGRGRTLEERVSIFDSIGDSIDDLVGTLKAIPSTVSSAIKNAAYHAYYSAKAALGLATGVTIAGASALVGTPISIATATNVLHAGYYALILPAGMALGTWLANLKNKIKTTFKQIANEVAIGGILGGLLHYIFLGSNYLGKAVDSVYGTKASLAVRGGCAVAQMPPFLAAHEYLNRALISDYKPQPLNIGKKLKGPMKWLIPLLVANFTVVPDYLGESYQMPTAATISIGYGIAKTEKKEEPFTQPTPAYPSQLAAAPGYG